MVYLAKLSAIHIIVMACNVGRIMEDELERIWNESVVA